MTKGRSRYMDCRDMWQSMNKKISSPDQREAQEGSMAESVDM